MSDTWTNRLSEYLDGDLPEKELAGLEAHLPGCADCRATLPQAPQATTTPSPILTNVGTYEANPRYAAAVASLERVLAQGRSRLDTATVRVIEKNLGIIDRAIRDAQSALAADPANSYLNLHLAQEMRRKLELLRQAAVLAGARS